MSADHYPVLYVDDEPENLVTFRYAVEQRFPVLTAGSGGEALQVLEREQVAVLLSDQRMPGMSGVELCEAARYLRPETVRIIITAYSDTQSAMDAINRGQVARYLTKPWRDDELLSLLDASVDLARLQETVREMQVRILQQGEPRAVGELRTALARQLRAPLARLEINTEQVRDLLDAGLHAWNAPERAHSVLTAARCAHDELTAPLLELQSTADKLERRERLDLPVAGASCDAARVVRAVCKVLEDSVRKVGELRVVLKASPRVPMEPAELGQVLSHLVQNSIESLSRPGAVRKGVIMVTVDETARGPRISVSDNGPGIEATHLTRLFDPYFSGDPGRDGIGLAIVQQLVTAAGGRVLVDDDAVEGACLVLHFPGVDTPD